MPDDEPRVRVELVSDSSLTAPQPVERRRSRVVPGLLLAVLLTGAFVGLSRLTALDKSTPADMLEEVTDISLPADSQASEEESNPALSSALVAQIDAYDRVTYTSISPQLTSIVRDGDEWVAIDDLGLIAHSPNLLSWVAIKKTRGQRAFALAATPDGPLALTTTGSDVRVIRVSDGQIEYLHPVRGAPVMGALAPDGRWAVVLTDTDGQSLLTGAPDGSTHSVSLADERPTSVAVTSSHVMLTLDDEAGATSLLFAPQSALTHKATEELALLGCDASANGARLVTTGDSAVHLVEAKRAWVVSDDGDRFDLVVDSALLPANDRLSVRPLATGIGWSIASPDSTDADPVVWITRDGETYEPQQIPLDRGRPGHVIWAYLGGSEGVGVRVSDTAAETGLLRIGDVRARHPRPHELSRNVQVERPDATLALTSPDCRSGAG